MHEIGARFTDDDGGGFPVEKATMGGCDLPVVYVSGEWQWLVRCQGRDVAEGGARGYLAARWQAEAAARWLLDFVPQAV